MAFLGRPVFLSHEMLTPTLLAKPASLVCAAQAQVVRWGSRPDALDSFTLAVASDSYTAAEFATCVGVTYALRAGAFSNLSSHALRCG